MLNMQEVAQEAVYPIIAAEYPVFAVIDPVAWPGVHDALWHHDPECLPLFKGDPPEDLHPFLPRVIRLKPDNEFTAQVLNGFGRGWSILLVCQPGTLLIDVVVGLLPLCHVMLPNKKLAWFRFYDPYVLWDILPSLDTRQLALFYGKHIQIIMLEYPVSDQWGMFTRPEELPAASKPPLILSVEQLEDLDTAHYALFMSEMVRYCLRKYFSGIIPAQRQAIVEGIHENATIAEKHGLVTMDQIRRFVELGAVHGWNFHLSGRPATILAGKYALPELKIAALESFFTRQPPLTV